MSYHLRTILLASLTAVAVAIPSAHAAEKALINPPPTAKDWADLTKLPDWSGVWNTIKLFNAPLPVNARLYP